MTLYDVQNILRTVPVMKAGKGKESVRGSANLSVAPHNYTEKAGLSNMKSKTKQDGLPIAEHVSLKLEDWEVKEGLTEARQKCLMKGLLMARDS